MSDWNKPPRVEGNKLIYSTYWDTGGGSIILREALNPDHPEHLYNYLTAGGIRPEDYGINHPVDEQAEEEYGHLSREQLISIISKQRKEIDALYRAGY